MKPRLETLFDEYQAYHRDPVNVAIHKVAVPAILFHVVAMLDWVTLRGSIVGLPLTLGLAVCALAAAWYLWMSPRYALIVVPFSFTCVWLGRGMPREAVILIAAAAWTAQLIGHARFERRAPAFSENLVQLLVGPAYVVALLLGDWPRGGSVEPQRGR